MSQDGTFNFFCCRMMVARDLTYLTSITPPSLPEGPYRSGLNEKEPSEGQSFTYFPKPRLSMPFWYKKENLQALTKVFNICSYPDILPSLAIRLYTVKVYSRLETRYICSLFQKNYCIYYIMPGFQLRS